MVPPPESTGDEFPDFEHMTFEEQMAWLESLAKRQGAREEELTTAADMEIAEVPEGTVIDEPGYVPPADSRAAKEAQRAKLEPEAKGEAAISPEAPIPPVEAVSEPSAEAAPWEVSLTDEAEPMVDPMQWLDDLAAHPSQGEVELDFSLDEVDLLGSLDEFNAVSLDNVPEPAEMEFDFGLEPEQGSQPPWEPEATLNEEAQDFILPDLTPEAESELFLAEEDMLLDGVDPMLWLESLAARQGARAEELTTSANLEIPKVPEDAVIDEPGYIPYDVITGGRKPSTEPDPRFEQPAPQESMPVWEEAQPEIEEPEIAQDELVGGSDPMEWLESLTRRGETPAEEFEFDTMAQDTFSTEAEQTGYRSPESLPPEFDAMDEPLSWLEELAAVPDEDTSDFLAFDTNFVEEEPQAASQEPAQAWSPDDILAGMTDEEIAMAQAQGRLTGEQELAWLQRQALKLAEARQVEEEMAFENELPPAELGELPPWLQQMRETDFVVADEAQGPALIEDDLAVTEPPDMPEWFAEPAPEAVFDVPELSIDADVESLWADIPTEIEVPPAVEEVSESELDAFIKGDFVLEQPDQLAEALDAEYERKLVGDESEPEWYRDAVAQGTELPQLESAAPAELAVEESALEEAIPVEMPDWLRETTEEIEPEGQVAMPAWLMEDIEPSAAPVDIPAVPDWLSEEPAAADWLAEKVEAPEIPEPAAADWPPVQEPEPQFQAAPPAAPVIPEPEPPAPVRTTVLPQGDLFKQYRERLEQDSSDYATRLALARALHANNDLVSSMDQYDVLIDTMQLLPDVSEDLAGLLDAQPNDPRLRRLLGDSYMRRGMLQQALEAYRSALDRL